MVTFPPTTVAKLLKVSVNTLAEMVEGGIVPKPDGNNGRPYWDVSTYHAIKNAYFPPPLPAFVGGVRTGRRRSVICVEKNYRFTSIAKAASWIYESALCANEHAASVSIGNACRGNKRLKSYMGFTWKYEENI
jgi:hypothetical protein